MTPEVGFALGILGVAIAVFMTSAVHKKGWGLLTRLFPPSLEAHGEKYAFASISVAPRGAFGFTMMLTWSSRVVIGNDAVSFIAMFPFNLLLRTISVPWSKVLGVELGSDIIGFRCALVRVQGFNGEIRVYFSPGKAVYQHWLRIRGENT
jgi:hypothetical protein